MIIYSINETIKMKPAFCQLKKLYHKNFFSYWKNEFKIINLNG